MIVNITSHEELFSIVKAELSGYELASVANMSGVSLATLYSWINGKVTCPHWRTLFNVSVAIEITLSANIPARLKMAS